MHARAIRRHLPLLLLTAPLMVAAQGEGCDGAINSRTQAPSLDGAWDIAYADDLAVKVGLGGAIYDARVGATGGTITIDHNGQPFTFELNCSRPEIVCPSEAWPTMVTAEHRNIDFPHRFFMTLPRQECSGTLVSPDAMACGAGTDNPDCDQVCDGDLIVRNTDHFGVVNEAGTAFDLLLGAGIATNGVNCGLLGVSGARANLATRGSATTDDWEATAMDAGEVIVAYAGACLWAGDTNGDAELEALVLGATLELRTSFTGTRR